MRFFVGLHQPHDAIHFERSFISVNRLRYRRTSFSAREWIMDSGAFSILSKFGGYPWPEDRYVDQILRWRRTGMLLAAVTQDYMCEPHMLAMTGLTIADHQRLTVERYDAITKQVAGRVYILPVLQGYNPSDYARHLKLYGKRLKRDSWVGVGSVCKRNGTPSSVLAILAAIKHQAPDLKLHGFGLKTTSLTHPTIRQHLHTADSMAWSFSARKQGRDPNDWREARQFYDSINAIGRFEV